MSSACTLGGAGVVEVGDEHIDFLLRYMLHHYHVRQLPSKQFVIALRQGVFADYLGRGTAEEDGIAVLVDPRRPADSVQLLLEIIALGEDVFRLCAPALESDGLDEPPELRGCNASREQLIMRMLLLRYGTL